MPALNLNLVQGATFTAVITVKNADKTLHDFTGSSAQMMVRNTITATGNPDLTLTSEPGGGITLGGTSGTIEITITAAQTSPVTFPANTTSTTTYYDLFETDADGEVTQILSGKITTQAAVTHQ